MIRFTLPLATFIGLAIFLWIGLGLDPRDLPSTRIDKPAPAFDLANLHAPDQRVTNQALSGKVWVLNVWASWCVGCRAEHAVITELARYVDIVGLNYKDQRDDAIGWLKQFGDPYLMSGHDGQGDVGIDYGVYGVPESFIIDQAGRIKFKHTGPVSRQALQTTLLPLIALLKKEA